MWKRGRGAVQPVLRCAAVGRRVLRGEDEGPRTRYREGRSAEGKDPVNNEIIVSTKTRVFSGPTWWGESRWPHFLGRDFGAPF